MLLERVLVLLLCFVRVKFLNRRKLDFLVLHVSGRQRLQLLLRSLLKLPFRRSGFELLVVETYCLQQIRMTLQLFYDGGFTGFHRGILWEIKIKIASGFRHRLEPLVEVVAGDLWSVLGHILLKIHLLDSFVVAKVGGLIQRVWVIFLNVNMYRL